MYFVPFCLPVVGVGLLVRQLKLLSRSASVAISLIVWVSGRSLHIVGNQSQIIGWCSEENRNWQLGGCNVHAVENWLLLGSFMGAPVTKAELEVVLQRTTKELSETIKAVIESKLDLGSAGVQSLEEFSKKVRTAMG